MFFQFLKPWRGPKTEKQQSLTAFIGDEISELRQTLGLRARSTISADPLSLAIENKARVSIETFVEEKILTYSDLLAELVKFSGKHCYIFIDDLYRLKREDQPYILQNLQDISNSKRTWLKIATVQNRTLTAVHTEGGRIGILPGPDAGEVDLDVSLEYYPATKQHLINLLQSLAREAGFNSYRGLFTDQAPDRLLRASGGVARDFMFLTLAALARARNRTAISASGGVAQFTIKADDVYEAVDDYSHTKSKEWRGELTEEDADRLLQVRENLTDFCLSERTNFFVSLSKYGADEHSDLLALHDLKAVHRVMREAIGTTVRSLYMLDFSLTAPERKKRRILLQDLDEAPALESILKDDSRLFDFNSA